MNNGYRPYYKRRMNWNSLLIGLATAGILWMCKLILAGVMYLVNTLPPMQADVNQLKTDVAALKVAQIAAKQELTDAERRVKAEFAEQLKKQQRRVASP